MVGWAVGGNWSIENDLSLPLGQSRLTTPAHLTPSYQHLIFSTLLQTPDIFSSLLNPGIIYSTTLWHSPLYCKKLQHLVFSFLNKGSLENKEKAILVSENGLFLTLGWGTSSARNENLSSSSWSSSSSSQMCFFNGCNRLFPTPPAIPTFCLSCSEGDFKRHWHHLLSSSVVSSVIAKPENLPMYFVIWFFMLEVIFSQLGQQDN